LWFVVFVLLLGVSLVEAGREGWLVDKVVCGGEGRSREESDVIFVSIPTGSTRLQTRLNTSFWRFMTSCHAFSPDSLFSTNQ
jgi:hypothetical protein